MNNLIKCIKVVAVFWALGAAVSLCAQNAIEMVTYFPVPYAQYNTITPPADGNLKFDVGTQKGNFDLVLGKKAGDVSPLTTENGSSVNLINGTTLSLQTDLYTNTATFGRGTPSASTLTFENLRINNVPKKANTVESPTWTVNGKFKLKNADLPGCADKVQWQKLSNNKWYLTCAEGCTKEITTYKLTRDTLSPDKYAQLCYTGPGNSSSWWATGTKDSLAVTRFADQMPQGAGEALLVGQSDAHACSMFGVGGNFSMSSSNAEGSPCNAQGEVTYVPAAGDSDVSFKDSCDYALIKKNVRCVAFECKKYTETIDIPCPNEPVKYYWKKKDTIPDRYAQVCDGKWWATGTKDSMVKHTDTLPQGAAAALYAGADTLNICGAMASPSMGLKENMEETVCSEQGTIGWVYVSEGTNIPRADTCDSNFRSVRCRPLICDLP